MSILKRVKALELPPSEYIVFAGGILDALDLRPANDIDIVVSESLFDTLRRSGEWREGINKGHRALYRDDIEIYLTWDRPEGDFTPNLAELKADELVVDGIPFCSPQRVLDWKRRANRPKDQQDIMLLEKWLDSQAN